jgi:ABC-2 type transport system ATP-binding protein
MFMDEPTLGMDVNAARALRAYVARWIRERPGRTVLLTTHYMAEAEELCDRLAIIDRGRVLACDSPAALRRQVQGGQHVELEVGGTDGVDGSPPLVQGIAAAWGAPHPERGTRTLKFRLPPERALVDVLRDLEGLGVRVDGVATRETTLEDVFIAVVGRGLDDTGAADLPARR